MDIVFFGANNILCERIMLALARHHRIVAVVIGATASPGPVTTIVRRLGLNRFARHARRLGCPYILVDNRAAAGDAALREAILRCRPEIGCVVAFPWILPTEVLELPARGCINMHPARLPAWRGADPVLWQVLEGVDPGGITVHEVDGGMDRGAILAACDLPLEPGVTGPVIWERIATLGAALMLQVLESIEAGTAVRTPQPEASPTRHANLVRGTADSLLALETRPLPEAWRLARALGWRLGALQPRLVHAGFLLSVEGFEAAGGAPGPVRLASDGGRWFLTHPEGRIVLRRRFAPLGWLRVLLS